MRHMINTVTPMDCTYTLPGTPSSGFLEGIVNIHSVMNQSVVSKFVESGDIIVILEM